MRGPRTTSIKLQSSPGEYLHVSGTIYELLQYLVMPRGGTIIGLGIEIVGRVQRRRRWHLGRECWRWVGYLTDGTTEVEGSASTTKMTTARAVAVAFLEARMAVDKTWTEVRR